MSSPRQPVRRFCLWCGKTLVRLLNSALALCAIVLGTILTLLLLRAEVPLPGALQDRLNAAARQSGFVIAWDEARTDFAGGLHLRGVSLSENEVDPPLFEARGLLVDLDWIALLNGHFEARTVAIDHANAYIPARFSPSGAREELVRALHATLRRNERGYVLENLRTEFGSISVTAQGIIEDPVLAQLMQREERPAPSLQPDQLFDSLGFALQLREWIGEWTQPHLDLVLMPGMPLRAQINFSAADAAFKGASASELEAEGSWEMPTRITEARIEAHNVTGPEDIHASARRITFALKEPWNLENGPWPSSFFATLSEIEAYQAEADYLRAELTELNSARQRLQTTLHTSGGWSRLSAAGALLQGEATVDFDLHPDLNRIFRHPQVEWIGIHKRLEFPHPPRLRGTLRLADGFAFEHAEVYLQARGFSSHTVPFDALDARARITPQGVDAYDLRARKNDYSLTGRVLQDFDPLDYRFLFKGTVRPRELNPMILDWWDRLWADIELTAGPVAGDTDVYSRWGDPDVTTSYTRMRSRGAVFKDVATERVNLTAWQGPGFVSVFDLEGTRPEGHLSGGVDFIYPRAPGEPQTTHIDALSTVDLDALNGILGTHLDELIAPFAFSKPPQIRIAGKVDEDQTTGAVTEDIHAIVHAHAPFHYKTVPIEGLAMELHVTPQRVYLEPMEIDLLGGRLQGHARVQRASESTAETLRLSLSARGLDPDGTTAALSIVATDGVPEQTFDERMAEGELIGGRLNFDGQLSGPLANPEALDGQVRFTLREAELGTVFMFGLLSELLDEVGLSFSRLELSEAEGTVKLAAGRAHMPKTVVHGKNLTIEADGDLVLATGNLDFNARLFLLKNPEPSLMSLFSTLLTPFGYVFEVKLFGSLEDPSWRFAIDPRNLFEDSKNTESEPSPSEDKEKAEKKPATK